MTVVSGVMACRQVLRIRTCKHVAMETTPTRATAGLGMQASKYYPNLGIARAELIKCQSRCKHHSRAHGTGHGRDRHSHGGNTPDRGPLALAHLTLWMACVSQQRRGTSTGLASSQRSSRKATQTRSSVCATAPRVASAATRASPRPPRAKRFAFVRHASGLVRARPGKQPKLTSVLAIVTARPGCPGSRPRASAR